MSAHSEGAAALTSASYDADNRLTRWGSISPTYDLNGNLTNDGSRTTYSWDARDRLTAISKTASFAYDAFGRRQSKTIGRTTTAFLYDGLNPIQELSGSTPTANLLTGFGFDQAYTRTTSAGARHFLSDALGSTVALSDGAGALQTQYTYEPFGNTTTSGPANDNSYQYTGRENDGTGLYYYRARYYNPVWQRFIAEDPIGLRGPINLYAYADGNPVIFVDPLGHNNYLAGTGGTFTIVTGIEYSLGLVINIGQGSSNDLLSNIGFFYSGGVTAGLNVGGDVFGGYVSGGIKNLRMPTVTVNVAADPVSFTVFLDPKTRKLVGGTVGPGASAPVIAFSVGYDRTGVVTVRDILNFVSSKL